MMYYLQQLLLLSVVTYSLQCWKYW